MQGRQYILAVLEEAVLRSKERIRGGAEPSCLLDFWTQQILTECQVRGGKTINRQIVKAKQAEFAKVPPHKYSSTCSRICIPVTGQTHINGDMLSL
jgi:hypothetical protein